MGTVQGMPGRGGNHRRHSGRPLLFMSFSAMCVCVSWCMCALYWHYVCACTSDLVCLFFAMLCMKMFVNFHVLYACIFAHCMFVFKFSCKVL